MIVKVNHIKDTKNLTGLLPAVRYTQPKYVYIAMGNARCPNAELYIKKGDHVFYSQVIGIRHAAFFDQPIHATCSGTYIGLEKHYHRSGKLTDFIKIENDGKDELDPSLKVRTPEEIAALTKDDMVEILKNCACVGLGGSSFPTYVKFQTDKPINMILVNGIECEPYITADHRLMLEYPYRVCEGLKFAMQAFGCKHAKICIKSKYTDIKRVYKQVLKEYEGSGIELCCVGNYYPQGWEIEVIKSALGIQVPSGVLPSKLGVLVLNVSTVWGLYKAVKHNMPVIERNFTLTGDGVKYPQNYKLRIGTSLKEIIDDAGGYKDEEKNKFLVLGGPMMGANLVRDDAVITKTCTSCIILQERTYVEEPCVHCASCVYSCPAGLQPVQIMQAVKNNDKEALKTKLNIKACILCGMCSYTCTSKIHLTDYCRKAKKMV
jgi:electron transport complex protein RnfC